MNEPARLLVLGVSFRAANDAARELLALDHDDTIGMLDATRARHPDGELIVLSTCNRTELWCAGVHPDAIADTALGVLHARRPEALLPGADAPPCEPWYRLAEDDAARHILRVTAGLESAILGDTQIPAQVRAAQDLAASHGTLGVTLRDVVTRALHTGRRARRETDLAHGGAGIGHAVTGLLSERLAQHPAGRGRPSVVLLGAGAVAASVAGQLAKHGQVRVTVLNRTVERARSLASRHGFAALPWSAMPIELVRADAAVAATTAPHPVLFAELLDEIAKRRDNRLLVVDAGFPRNVEACPAVEVVSLATVAERDTRTHARRAAACPAVEAMVDAELEQWAQWLATRDLEHVIKSLYADSDRLTRETARELSLADPAQTEPVLRRAVRRMLHEHVTRLRAHTTVNPGG